MLNELLEADAGLTGWEMDFLDSMVGKGYLDDDHRMSENEAYKIEEIWNRIFR